MIKLISNELYKAFHKKSIIVITLISLALIVFVNYVQSINIYDNTNTKERLKEVETEFAQKYPEEMYDNYDYIDYLIQIDVLKTQLEYDQTSWQYAYIEDNLYDFYHKYYEAKYITKEESSIKNYEYKINEAKSLLASGDWKSIVNKQIKDKEVEISELKNAIQNEQDYQAKKMYEYNLKIAEIEMEIANIRIEKEIDFGRNYLSDALSMYQAAKTELLNETIDDLGKKEAKKNLAINKYVIDNKVDFNSTSNANVMYKDTIRGYLELIIIAAIAASCSIVSEEFNKGTIKLLLVRPFNRYKILLAKYITSLTILLLFIIFVLISQYIAGGLFLGFDSYGQLLPAYYYTTETIVPMSSLKLCLIQLLGYLPELLLVLTLSFSISTIFTSSVGAIAVSLISTLLSSLVNMYIIAKQISWLRIIPTMCWDLNPYFFGNTPEYKYGSLQQSIIISIAYLIIMLSTSLIIFKKRDVKNI